MREEWQTTSTNMGFEVDTIELEADLDGNVIHGGRGRGSHS